MHIRDCQLGFSIIPFAYLTLIILFSTVTGDPKSSASVHGYFHFLSHHPEPQFAWQPVSIAEEAANSSPTPDQLRRDILDMPYTSLSNDEQLVLSQGNVHGNGLATADPDRP